MIIKSELHTNKISSIRITDELTLELTYNDETTRVKVEVKSIEKQKEKCNGCRRLGDLTEFMKKKWCANCLRNERERRSEIQMGHKRYGKEFGGHLKINSLI